MKTPVLIQKLMVAGQAITEIILNLLAALR